MPDVLVRNVPERVLEALKRRAQRQRRSLQQELLEIRAFAARGASPGEYARVAASIRERLAYRPHRLVDEVWPTQPGNWPQRR